MIYHQKAVDMAHDILREMCWPSKWKQHPDGSYLPILPSPEAVSAALVVTGAAR